jgi:hypothetical protein
MKFAGQKLRAAAIASAIVHCGFISFARSHVISSAQKDEIVIHSGLVTIHYHRRAGTMDIVWRDGPKIQGITSGAQLADGRALSTSAYTEHGLLQPGADARNSDEIAGAHECTHCGRRCCVRQAAPTCSRRGICDPSTELRAGQ